MLSERRSPAAVVYPPVRRDVRPLVWTENRLLLLDQRILPHREEWISCTSASEVEAAIRTMVVRGAPAIGVAAAFGVALEAIHGDVAGIEETIRSAAALLREARPTAVNLHWALDRMLEALERYRAEPLRLGELMLAEAQSIHAEDLEANRAIGRYGAALLGHSATVLTHCNAGALATSGYGTALGVVRAACEEGKKIAVYADETRPFLQGARLTAWELQQDEIDVTLITDNMAGHFFQQKTFDAVIVGADRIARNGDAANKIGTYTLAVLASAHGVPFYIAAPVSTIDHACANGAGIPIEERSAREVTHATGADDQGELHTINLAPAGIGVRHPAFDVTPAALITAIITDRGILRAPYEEAIARLINPSPPGSRIPSPRLRGEGQG